MQQIEFPLLTVHKQTAIYTVHIVMWDHLVPTWQNNLYSGTAAYVRPTTPTADTTATCDKEAPQYVCWRREKSVRLHELDWQGAERLCSYLSNKDIKLFVVFLHELFLLSLSRSVHDFYSQCNSLLTLKWYTAISLSCTRKSTQFCSRKWSSLPKSKNSLLLLTSHSRAGSNLLRSKSFFSTGYRRDQGGNHANRRTVIYTVAVAVGVVGLTYAAVPLYRLFCQVGTKWSHITMCTV